MRLIFFAVVALNSSARGAVVTHVQSEFLFTVQPDGSQTPIDFNGDGLDDLIFGGTSAVGTFITTPRANRYFGIPAAPPNLGGSPSSLEEGTLLGPGAISIGLSLLSSDPVDGFVEPGESGVSATLTTCLTTGCFGDFYPGPDTLRESLGVEFSSSEGIHYGFVDLEFSFFNRGGVIMGWAYESEPNTPITTFAIPEPSPILFTFLGGAILLRRRR